MENRYFIVDVDDKKLDKILSISVGRKEKLRYSLDKTKCLIKLKINNRKNHFELLKYKEYTHKEIIEILNSEEWSYTLFE